MSRRTAQLGRALRRRLSRDTVGLARDSSLLMVATAATTVGMMGQIALITHLLGVRQYGLFALTVAAVALVAKFFDLEVGRTAMVFSAPRLKRDMRAVAGVFQFSYAMDVATGVLGFAVVAAMAPFVGPALIGSQGTLLLVLYGVTLLASTANTTSNALLQSLGRYQLLAGVVTLRELARIALVAGAILQFDSLLAVVVALVAHNLLAGAAMFGVAARAFRLRAGTARLWQPARREIAAVRRPMLGMMIHTNLITYARLAEAQGPTLLLGALAGPVEAGVFKIGMAAATGIGQLATPAWSAVMPRLARLWASAAFTDIRKLLGQSTALALALLAPAAALAVLLREPLLTIFAGEGGAQAGTVFALAAAAQVVNGVLFWNGPLLYAAHRARVATAIYLPTVALMLALVLALLPGWGANGAALAVLAAAVTNNTLQSFAALRGLRADEHRLADTPAREPHEAPDPSEHGARI